MASTSTGKDPLLFNKMSGALLGACLFVMGLNLVSEAVFHPMKPAVPGYDLPAAEEASSTQAAAPAAAAPIAERLAKADVAKGETVAKQCVTCHSLKADGSGSRTGPSLFGIMDRAKAGVANFNYSAAMKTHASEKWTAEDIDAFVANPKGAVPGTLMATFNGVTNPDRRGDLIAYLQTLK
ncbi:MAG: c-type cytochrome [Beijerinckiaceae bacterium]